MTDPPANGWFRPLRKRSFVAPAFATRQIPLAAVVVLGASAHAIWFGEATGLVGILGAIAGGTALVILLRAQAHTDPGPSRLSHRQRALAAAEAVVRRMEANWEETCGDGAFCSRRKELEAARRELEALPALEGREWAELTERHREIRLQLHLRTFPLEFSRIPGLEPGQLARLASRGVSTAADISPGPAWRSPASTWTW